MNLEDTVVLAATSQSQRYKYLRFLLCEISRIGKFIEEKVDERLPSLWGRGEDSRSNFCLEFRKVLDTGCGYGCPTQQV